MLARRDAPARGARGDASLKQALKKKNAREKF